jgi:5'-methylthioadenosine phosphorylase
MRSGIIGGTGIYELPGVKTNEDVVKTQYGQVKVYLGQGVNEDLVFITRHGADHSVPPHKVNFRANITAFKKLGVERVLAIYCVGSLNTMLPPGGMVLLDQLVDFSMNRDNTFFQGGKYGFASTDMVEPFCPTLRDIVYQRAQYHEFNLLPNGTYISFSGPRFETAAEIRFFSGLGGDVIGMTGGPEAALAREAGLHFAAAAYSVNYGAGLKHSVMKIEKSGLSVKLEKLVSILIEALRQPFIPQCICDSAVHYCAKPTTNLFD